MTNRINCVDEDLSGYVYYYDCLHLDTAQSLPNTEEENGCCYKVYGKNRPMLLLTKTYWNTDSYLVCKLTSYKPIHNLDRKRYLVIGSILDNEKDGKKVISVIDMYNIIEYPGCLRKNKKKVIDNLTFKSILDQIRENAHKGF